jgi:hypothetical protein
MRKEHYLVNVIRQVISKKRKYLSSYESSKNITNKQCNKRTQYERR